MRARLSSANRMSSSVVMFASSAQVGDGKRLGALVDLFDEWLADLDADEVGLEMLRRALEQEARVSAAQLDFERPPARMQTFGARIEKRRPSGFT